MSLAYSPFETLDQELGTRRGGRWDWRRLEAASIDRWACGIGGGLAIAFGLATAQKRGRFWSGAALILGGGALLYRAKCDAGRPGVKVEKRITIARAAEDLFRYWRNFENLPRFMSHLESVHDLGGGKSQWIAKSPNGSVKWNAEIINEHSNQMIAWRSLPGADIENAGSVWFSAGANPGETEVKVAIEYRPPGGKLGALAAKLFGEGPAQQVEEDLRRFKEAMENGATAAA